MKKNKGENQGSAEQHSNLPLKILLTALLLTILLCVLQLLMLQGASFLGIQAQGVSWQMIRLYAGVGLREFLSIASLSGLWILTGTTLTLLNLRTNATSGRQVGRIVGAALPMTAYCCEALSCLVTYPALFEEYLNTGSLQLLYKASFTLNPDYLHYLAIALLSLSLVRPLGAIRVKAWLATVVASGIALLLGGLSSGNLTSSLLSPDMYRGEQTNVLLLAVDSLRYDMTDAPAMTPNLNMLKAQKGTLEFRDHHIGVPRTFPSWIELIQGRYAAKTGIRHMFPSMAQRRRPMQGLVSALNEAGYESSVISDFAGDIFPRFRAGYTDVNTPELSIPTLVRMGVDQAFPLFLPLLLRWPGNIWFHNLLESPNFADADSLKDKMIRKLRDGKGKPFFLTGFFSTAHFPYAAPWPWNVKFTSPEYKGPFFFQKNPDLGDGDNKVDPDDIRQIKGLYQGAVAATDDAIGHIVSWLKKHNVYQNTMIIITADHGEDLYDDGVVQGHGDHLLGNHVTRVPLIIKTPESFSIRGGKIPFITRSIDVMPTVLGLLGIEAPECDGTDLSPWIKEGNFKNAPRLEAYSETGLWFSRGGSQHYQNERLDYPGISGLLNFDPGNSGDIILNPQFENVVITAKHRSFVSGDYKLVYMPTHNGPVLRLFNRKDDPENKHDISGSRPEVFQSLKGKFFDLIREIEGKHQLIEDFVVES